MSQMPGGEPKRVVAQMNARTHDFSHWEPERKRRKKPFKRPRKTAVLAAAAILCALTGAAFTPAGQETGKAVISRITSGFEYDETLGRLQFVSRVLPESAMVFLTSTSDTSTVTAPVSASAEHPWSEQEPWLEYACTGSISACMSGEVMTVVRSRANAYTVRLLHDNGYESVYSGLRSVRVGEGDSVSAGQVIGESDGFAAFELRRDGLSIQPVFAAR